MLTATNPNELLTDEQTAELIGGITTQTLSVWRCTGRYNLPFVKVGRLVRYKRADVEQWIESRTVRTADEE